MSAAQTLTGPGWALVLTVPIRTVSETNAHEHWRVRQRRAKEQRGLALLLCRTLGKPPAAPLTITLTRIASRRLDSDNLPASQKHIRDGIADWLALPKHDAHPGLTWRYEQTKGDGCRTLVRIEATSDSSEARDVFSVDGPLPGSEGPAT